MVIFNEFNHIQGAESRLTRNGLIIINHSSENQKAEDRRNTIDRTDKITGKFRFDLFT